MHLQASTSARRAFSDKSSEPAVAAGAVESLHKKNAAARFAMGSGAESKYGMSYSASDSSPLSSLRPPAYWMRASSS
jgi:hypothetical protein